MQAVWIQAHFCRKYAISLTMDTKQDFTFCCFSVEFKVDTFMSQTAASTQGVPINDKILWSL